MRFRLNFCSFAAVMVVAGSLAGQAARAQTVVASTASPGDVLSVEVQIDAAGKLGYDIQRRGKEVIGLSRLGFNLANAAKAGRRLQPARPAHQRA